MKQALKPLLAAAALMAAAGTAQAAMRVTNLDDVTHVVVFEEVGGSKLMRTIDKNETIRSMASGGRVYLKGKEEAAFFVEELDRLVIWPEGKLQLQMRMRRTGRN